MRRLTPALALAALVTTAAAAPLPVMPPIDPAARVLVVAPHPDDEALCCGGLIDTARRAGADVSIVWITSGEGFRLSAMVAKKKVRPRRADMRRFAQRRIQEAHDAAELLDVARDHQYFLGYPDRGVQRLLFEHYDSPYRSKYSGANAVPWEQALSPGSPYDGANLESDFAHVVARVRPTLVLAPSPNDTHPDHRGTGILVMRIMSARGEMDRVRFWIVHGGHRWPAPTGLHMKLPQTPPPTGKGMPWEQFELDAEAREVKRRAVRAHETQLKVMGSVMMSHVRATELYSRWPTAQPPAASP